jgi:hypothetical protein
VRQNKLGKSQGIAIESALTRRMYAWILLLLGVRSWGFVLLCAVLFYLIWRSVIGGDYTLLWIYTGLLVAIYGGAVLVSVMAKKNRRAFSPVRYTFDASGVSKQTGASNQRLNWSAFVRWRKLGSYYLIYQTKRSFFVVPEAKIPAGRSTDFEVLLKQNVLSRRARLLAR